MEERKYKNFLMRLMRTMGFTSKFVGEVVSFLYTEEECFAVLQYLMKYQDSSEEEIMMIVGKIRESPL